MLNDIFARPVLKPLLKKQLLTNSHGIKGLNIMLAMRWDRGTYANLKVSDGFYSIQAEMQEVEGSKSKTVKERLESIFEQKAKT